MAHFTIALATSAGVATDPPLGTHHQVPKNRMYSIWVVRVKRYELSANLCTSDTPVAREISVFPEMGVTFRNIVCSDRDEAARWVQQARMSSPSV